MSRFVTFLIKAYQLTSPALFPKACRYHPSCSTYAIQALEKYGLIKGALLSISRIIRCSPFSRGGYDPVK